MNPPDSEPGDARLQSLPPPVLRDAARQRSLAAALAALPAASARPGSPAPAAPRRRFLRLSRAQLTGLAACWVLAGYFRLSAPPAPGKPGTSPAGGYAVWPGPWHSAQDEETAKLLATLYPGRFRERP